MGCIHPQPVSFNDETVRSRERKLGLHNYTIDQIKEKFFNLNSQNEIALEKVIIGLEFLGKRYSQLEKDHILIPFLKGFVDNEETLDECFEYNFTNLMAVFFLLSNSSGLEKGRSLFRFYDTDKSNTLDKQEIEKMLGNLVRIIDIYSENILRHDQMFKAETYQSKLILDLISDEKKLEKTQIIEEILRQVLPLLLDNDDSKQLTEKEFGEKLKSLKKLNHIDLLSTTGIRILISETQEKLKFLKKP